MIEVKNIKKTYGKKDQAFHALKGVDFSIPTGASVAIVGKSGSGKSTLMHIMSGLDSPTSGQIIIDEQDLFKLKKRAMDRFRNKTMSFIFQAFFVQANDTCLHNVTLPLEIAGISPLKQKSMAEKALAKVELSDKINQKAGNLSGGQKQRLAIARAIVNNPDILFADEPTGNLDSKTGAHIEDILFGLNKEGKTLIIVTHDEELAAKCDMQIYVKDGNIQRIEKGGQKQRRSA
jgi:putative ABC transport system ATP-binding protein